MLSSIGLQSSILDVFDSNDELVTSLKEFVRNHRTSVWIIGASSLLYASYKFATWNFDTFQKLGINGPRPWPIIGTLMPMIRKGIIEHDIEMRKYGKIVGTFAGRQPVLMVYDPDMLREILIKEFANFQNRSLPPMPDYPCGRMLILLKDDHWKHVRNTMTPAFSSGKLRRMEEKIASCSECLLNNLRREMEANMTVDFSKYCGAYTMDVIARTVFGLQIDSHNDPNNQFARMSSKVFASFAFNVKTFIFFFCPLLIKPLGVFGLTLYPRDATEFFVSAVNEAMRQRTSSADQVHNQADFLQLMVNAHIDDPDDKDIAADEDILVRNDLGVWSRRGLTHEEVLAQAILLLLAGYETTANTLSFIGYLLAVNDECQRKLIAEIADVMKGQERVTSDVIQRMPYLDMCISEALRMYPVGFRTDREAKQDVTINGILIPKGTSIIVPLVGIHNDPDYWEEPSKFDPDRFLPEAKAARNPYCYLPFGVGPRACIGQRLALIEIKFALVRILQTLQFVVCKDTQIPLELDKIHMKPADGVKLQLKIST